jgi:hypothetical protein
MRCQHAAAGLTDVVSDTIARFTGYWGEHLRRSAPQRDERSCTVSRERRRLPGDALIELDVGLGLFEEVPFRHQFRSIVPRGWTASGGARRLEAQALGTSPSQTRLWAALRPSLFARSMAALGRELPTDFSQGKSAVGQEADLPRSEGNRQVSARSGQW